MTRWEYSVLELPLPGDTEELNQLGGQGWELVSETYDKEAEVWRYCFKRPKRKAHA